MRILMQGKLPPKVYLAFSGGVDSVAVLDFLRRKHQVHLLHVNHGTEHANEFEGFVRGVSEDYGCALSVYRITKPIPKGESKENFWRNERYAFFHGADGVVVTAHHLDDCMETWIWSALHGNPRIIPYSNRNVVRPFRKTPKASFKAWAEKHGLPWIDDPSNRDTRFTRNYIRHELMPHALQINPGLAKVIRKKIDHEWSEENGFQR